MQLPGQLEARHEHHEGGPRGQQGLLRAGS